MIFVCTDVLGKPATHEELSGSSGFSFEPFSKPRVGGQERIS
jgi:hypothetical protein